MYTFDGLNRISTEKAGEIGFRHYSL